MAAKLTYFNIMGRGEPIRLLLAAAKISFEDVRIETLEEWTALKPTLKWPHLPKLEIDGKELFQSRAICRYVARKVGLAGSNASGDVLIDMTADALEDLREKITYYYYLPDSPEREEGLRITAQKSLSLYLKNFQQQLIENNGYLVGGKDTWADFMFASYADHLNHLLDYEVLTDFKELKKLKEKANMYPGVKEYIASRPKIPKDLRALNIF